jgi:cell division protein ZapA (FtsZ GTPase activity inhibitor)
MFRVVPICEHDLIAAELTEVLQEAETSSEAVAVSGDTWASLEGKHVLLWQSEKEKYITSVKGTADYKLESINSNYRNRKRTLEQKIRDAFDEKIRRMYQSELATATENFNGKVAEINERTSRADIHTSLVANGLIEIRKG